MIQNSRDGFTLIELLVTVALTAVLAVTGFLVLGGFNAGRNLKSEGEQLAAALQNARQNSLSQQNGTRWGVHLSNATSTQGYVVFSGLSYASGTVASTHTLRGPIQFGNPSTSSTIDVIFGPITGYLSSPRVLTLNDGRGDGLVYDISINALGRAATKSDTGLVGYWHLDEGTSTVAYDASGTGNNGTLFLSPTWQGGTNCKAGGCLSLDGTQYVSVPDTASIDPTSAWSLSAWIKRASMGVQHSIVEKYDWISGKGNYGMRVGANDKFLAFVVDGLSSNDCGITTTTISSGTWFFVAATFDNSAHTLICYVNGVAEATNSSVALHPPDSTTTVKIGCRGNDCNTKFSGILDEIRVYNRALSAQEILDQYNALQ